jgi:putrescine:ornithine antiporter
MAYSIYALWASGFEAVMGGLLVMGVGYVIWGYMAPRFQMGPLAPQAGRA